MDVPAICEPPRLRPEAGLGRRAAVVGHPIAHSLSPTLHNAAYAALGLGDWSYTALDVEASGLEALISDVRSNVRRALRGEIASGDGGWWWAGLSLTMPHKQIVRVPRG
jgi:shikimate dehydrogenase